MSGSKQQNKELLERKEKLEGIVKTGYSEYDTKEIEPLEDNFRYHAMSYVWEVVAEVIQEYGSESLQFQRVSKTLLSEKELELVKKNLKKEQPPVWKIKGIEDRTYKVEEVLALYEAAKKVYDGLIKERAKAPTQELFNDFKENTENSPIYGLYTPLGTKL